MDDNTPKKPWSRSRGSWERELAQKKAAEDLKKLLERNRRRRMDEDRRKRAEKEAADLAFSAGAAQGLRDPNVMIAIRESKVTLSNGHEVELTDRERMLMASVVITLLKDEGRG